MTTPKLHDAAVRAAEQYAGYRLTPTQQEMESEFHAAIEDHLKSISPKPSEAMKLLDDYHKARLKSEGWEELRAAAHKLHQYTDSRIRSQPIIHTEGALLCIEVKKALLRLPGEKP